MRTCEKCRSELAADAELCACGAWLRQEPRLDVSPGPAPHRAPASMLKHAVAMLLIAPLIWGIAFGLLDGFSAPSSAHIFITTFAEWVGSVLIGLVIAWFTLFFRKPEASWTILAVLTALAIYSVHYADKKLADRSTPTAISTVRAGIPADRPASSSTGADDLVTEAIETLPGLTSEMITPAFIDKFERLVIADAEQKIERRAREAGSNIGPIGVRATSLTFHENESRAVITEVILPAEYGKLPTTKIVWWVQGHQLKRVYCQSRAGEIIDYRRGKCGRQVEKTFGYRNWYRP